MASGGPAGREDQPPRTAEEVQPARAGTLDQPIKLGPLGLDWPIHPLLFALSPVASLLASNLEYMAVGEAARAAVFVSLLAVALTLAAWFPFRDWKKAALIATPVLAVALSYGHLYSALKLVFGALIVRHRYLGPLLIIALAGWVLTVKRRVRAPSPLTAALNVAGAAALLFPLMALVTAPEGRFDAQEEVEEELTDPLDDFAGGPEGRDVYYIILDGYGRQDVLLDIYGHDNSEFLQALEQRGFQIAEYSTANYNQTVLSLASSLNMDYLDSLLGRRDLKLTNAMLVRLIWRSQVRRELARWQYDMVAFKTGFSYTAIEDAELFLFPEGQGDEVERTSAASRANAFEGLLFESSAARVLLDSSEAAREAVHHFLNEPLFAEQRERVLFTLETLGSIPELPGRHFVFAHVVAPHPPFVFDEQGEPLTPDYPFSFADGSHYLRYGTDTREDYIAGYRGQLRYLNGLLIETLDQILESSKQLPIIILQGDHGPGAYLRWENIMESNLEERSAILNAFLLPGAPDAVYPTISPVNAFRLVLSRYFGADLPPLPDCTYFSSTSAPDRLEQAWDCLPPGPDWPEIELSP